MSAGVGFEGTDRFTVRGRLGSGGMAEIYRAYDREQNTDVALKVLPVAEGEALLRLKTEFRALRNLRHRNLLRLGELFEQDGQWFFTMELIEGVSFIEFVRKPAYDEARLRSAFRQVAGALSALHGQGLVHRDVKPANILVTGTGRVVLLDFGLVKDDVTEELSAQDHVLGTAAYMAPEQGYSMDVGPAADMYAAGTMLFEALTGDLPFAGSAVEIMLTKQRTVPPLASSWEATVPDDLERVCHELMSPEPHLRPTAEQLARYLQGSAPTVAAVSSLPSPVFVGRDDELRILRGALSEVRRLDSTVAVVVEGESGSGKSALIQSFLKEVSESDDSVVVLFARCHERESVPYNAVDGVVDSLVRSLSNMSESDAAHFVPRYAEQLVRTFPVLEHVAPIARAGRGGVTRSLLERRTRVFSAFRELLSRLCEQRPVIIAIDDLQWSDADSLALLAETLRPPDPPPLLFVATVARGGPSGGEELLARTIASALPLDVRTVPLGGLAEPDARQLASLLLGADSELDGRAENIARESEGHPLFLRELARHAMAVPTTGLDEVLWANVRSLETLERRIVELVVLAGAPISLDVLDSALDTEPGGFLDSISGLVVRRMVRTTGLSPEDRVEIYHNRIRGALNIRMTEQAQRDGHRSLARSLELLGSTEAETLATHWHLAGELGKGARYAIEAAERAEGMLAFDRAADLYRAALEAGTFDAQEIEYLRERLADALISAGRGPTAAVELLKAAHVATGIDALSLKRRAADQLLRSGHIDEGLATIDEVLDLTGGRVPESRIGAVASLLWQRALLRMRGMRYRLRLGELEPERVFRIDTHFLLSVGLGFIDGVRGFNFHTRTLRDALRLGEPGRLCRSLATEAVYVSAVHPKGDQAPRALMVMDRARQLYDQVQDPQLLSWLLGCEGGAAYLTGDWQRAAELTARAYQLTRKYADGAHWQLVSTQVVLVSSLFHLGQLRELCRAVFDTLREAKALGDRFGSTNMRIAFGNFAWLVFDAPGQAEAEADEAIAQWRDGFDLQHSYYAYARTQCDLYQRRPAVALDRVRRVWGPSRNSLQLTVKLNRVNLRGLRARASVMAAELDDSHRHLLEVAEADARAIAREDAGWTDGISSLVTAGVARVRGDVDSAVVALEKAERQLGESAMLLHVAVARLLRGRLIGGDVGEQLVFGARRWMREQGVRNLDRMCDTLAPGFIIDS